MEDAITFGERNLPYKSRDPILTSPGNILTSMEIHGLCTRHVGLGCVCGCTCLSVVWVDGFLFELSFLIVPRNISSFFNISHIFLLQRQCDQFLVFYMLKFQTETLCFISEHPNLISLPPLFQGPMDPIAVLC